MSRKAQSQFALFLGGSHFLYGPFMSLHKDMKSVKKHIGYRDDFTILKAIDNKIVQVGKNGARK